MDHCVCNYSIFNRKTELTGFGSFMKSHNESVDTYKVTTKSVNNHHHHMVLVYLREDS